MEVIDGGLEAAGCAPDSDRLRVIQEEAWAVLEAGAERGDYTMDVALARYRDWHNTYCLGAAATANVVPIRPPEPPAIIA